MKIREIAIAFGVDQADFEEYLKKVGANVKWGITGSTLEDDIQGHVQRYKEYALQKRIRLEAERKKADAETEIRNQALTKILVTSGFNFEGYRIKKYSDVVSGEAAISVKRGRGEDGILDYDFNVKEDLPKSLAIIRRRAVWALKGAAYDLDCNAVIGVDLDYITLGTPVANDEDVIHYSQPYVFCAVANGTAVVVEKDE